MIARVIGFLGTPLALKAGLVVGVLIAGYSWHTSAIRNAKQEQAAETRTIVLEESAEQYQAEKQKYEQRIMDLETTLTQLARTRVQAAQKIEVITRQAETLRNEVDTKTDADVLAAIRQRLRATQ